MNVSPKPEYCWAMITVQYQSRTLFRQQQTEVGYCCIILLLYWKEAQQYLVPDTHRTIFSLSPSRVGCNIEPQQQLHRNSTKKTAALLLLYIYCCASTQRRVLTHGLARQALERGV